MSEKTNKNGLVGKFKATSAVQIVSKDKRINHKCCTTANCNNQSENRPDLLFRAFLSDTTTEEVGNSYEKRRWFICYSRKQVLFFLNTSRRWILNRL